MAFIRKGRIVADGVAINCTVCGKEYPGSKSLMCPSCMAKMEKDLHKVSPASADPPKDKSPKPPKPPDKPGGKDDRAFSTIRKTKI